MFTLGFEKIAVSLDWVHRHVHSGRAERILKLWRKYGKKGVSAAHHQYLKNLGYETLDRSNRNPFRHFKNTPKNLIDGTMAHTKVRDLPTKERSRLRRYVRDTKLDWPKARKD